MLLFTLSKETSAGALVRDIYVVKNLDHFNLILSFDQLISLHKTGNFAQEMGLKENMTIIANQIYYSKETQARICYHAKMGSYYFDLIKNVFGESNRARLKFVLGTQAAWLGPIEVDLLNLN
jgi:hypothetical protein